MSSMLEGNKPHEVLVGCFFGQPVFIRVSGTYTKDAAMTLGIRYENEVMSATKRVAELEAMQKMSELGDMIRGAKR